jgi:hypothetical protein
MIAAAATIAVVYPHMNSIGGDSFWVIHSPGKAMGGIDACGAAAGLATKEWYRERGITKTIPFRGPVAANLLLEQFQAGVLLTNFPSRAWVEECLYPDYWQMPFTTLKVVCQLPIANQA